MPAVDFKEGDRVQYKSDLSSEKRIRGTIQKVLKEGNHWKWKKLKGIYLCHDT